MKNLRGTKKMQPTHTPDKKHIQEMSLLLFEMLSGDKELDDETMVSPKLKHDRQKCDALIDKLFALKQKLEPLLPDNVYRNELGECLLLESIFDEMEELARIFCQCAFYYGVAYGCNGVLPKPMPDMLRINRALLLPWTKG